MDNYNSDNIIIMWYSGDNKASFAEIKFSLNFTCSVSFSSHTQNRAVRVFLIWIRKLGSKWLSELPKVKQLILNTSVTSTSSSVPKIHATFTKCIPLVLYWQINNSEKNIKIQGVTGFANC